MLSNNLSSFLKHEVPSLNLLFQTLNSVFQERAVIIIWDKAYLVRLGFVEYIYKTSFFGHMPNIVFFELSKWQYGFSQTLLRNTPKGIRLVFVLISTFRDKIASIGLFYLCIMPRRDMLTIKLMRRSSKASHLICVLHKTQGLGVRPSRYSRVK